MKGRVIAFEGIDGAGKASNVAALRKELESRGRKVAVYSYPDYKSVYGRIIHDFLHGKLEIGYDEFLLLQVADKIKDVKRINDEVEKGSVVLLDRSFLTSVAYQGAGGGSVDDTKRIFKMMGYVKPDLTFYLDISVEVSMARKMEQKRSLDRIEKDREYLRKVKGNFDALCAEGYGSGRWVRIDASMPFESVAERVLEETLRIL